MTRTVARATAVIGAVVALALGMFLAADTASAQSTTTAVIVIDTGSSVRAVTVDVGGGTSGIEALRRAAGVETIGFGGIGVAVCGIDGVGNPPDRCLIGSGGAYWAYWRATGGSGSWAYAGGGAGATTVHGGDVEGWRYGTGEQPRASADFCAHAHGAPPPAPPAPPAPAADPPRAPAPPPGGAAAGGGSGAPATGATGGPASGPAAAPGGSQPGTADPAAGDDQAAAPTAGTGTDDAPDATTTTSERARRRLDGDRETALAAVSTDSGGDGGSSSPVGVAIAGALLVIAAVVALVVRRRARGTQGDAA